MRLLIALCVFGALSAVALCDDVMVLTPDNFDSVVGGDKPVLVEFYAPWCGHCKRLEGPYSAAASRISRSDAIIAKVNADEHRTLGSRFGIRGFPTLKWFPKGDITSPEDYKGGRTEDSIVDFVSGKLGIAKPSGSSGSAGSSSVVDLDASKFDEVVKKGGKKVLVKFYAPWCGHCKALAPEFEKLGELFKNSENGVIAKVNCDENKQVCVDNGVRGYPTLKYFEGGKAVDEYRGQRTAEAIKVWFGEKTGDIVPAKNANSANANANANAGDNGAVVVLDESNFDSVVGADKAVFVKFFAPWCGHCKRMAEDWKKLADNYKGNDSVVIAEVNCDSLRSLCSKHGIRGYPTIKWYNKGSKDAEQYAGGRSLENFKQFADGKI